MSPIVVVDFNINEMPIKIVYKNKWLGAREWVRFYLYSIYYAVTYEWRLGTCFVACLLLVAGAAVAISCAHKQAKEINKSRSLSRISLTIKNCRHTFVLSSTKISALFVHKFETYGICLFFFLHFLFVLSSMSEALGEIFHFSRLQSNRNHLI